MLAEIRQEAEALVAKQTWLRKGFIELLEKMDNEVKPIVGDFVVRGKLYEFTDDYRPDCRESWFLVFDGRDDAEFYIQSGTEGYVGQKYETVRLDFCSIFSLRNCVGGIPSALEEILGKLQSLNERYQEAVGRLQEMVEKLKN